MPIFWKVVSTLELSFSEPCCQDSGKLHDRELGGGGVLYIRILSTLTPLGDLTTLFRKFCLRLVNQMLMILFPKHHVQQSNRHLFCKHCFK